MADQTLTGTATSRLKIDSPASGDRWFAKDWDSVSIGTSNSTIAVEIGDTVPAVNNVWRGGRIVGTIDPALTWRQVHDDVSGGAMKMIQAGHFTTQYLRVHNVEDGIKPREPSVGDNRGVFTLSHSYFSCIRDDVMENDHFMPGKIVNCLFDGVFTFLSEQNQEGKDWNSIGPNESKYINITNVAVRLDGRQNSAYDGTNPSQGPGLLFKWQGTHGGYVAANHIPVLDSFTFAISAEPVDGWGKVAFPAGTIFKHSNTICWLGSGAYPGLSYLPNPLPAGLRVLTSTTKPTAINHWKTKRNNWLTSHGMPTSTDAADVLPQNIAHSTSIPTPTFTAVPA